MLTADDHQSGFYRVSELDDVSPLAGSDFTPPILFEKPNQITVLQGYSPPSVSLEA